MTMRGDDVDASFRTPERKPRARTQPPAAPGRTSTALAYDAPPPPSPFSPMDVDSTPSFPRVPAPIPTAKRLVSVFDWDDTLCPSFWLHRRGLLAAHGLLNGAPLPDNALDRQFSAADTTSTPRTSSSPLSREDRRRLEQLEDQALALLQLASRFGPVFIITAATLQWVVASAEHFLPRVRRFLLHRQHRCVASEQLQVVSAREWYHQHVAPRGDPLSWKLATFDALCGHLKVQHVHAHLDQRTELLSVGDSRFEREACVRMEQRAPACLSSKTLKFVDAPSLDELSDQLRMAHSVYERVCRYDGGLHLYVARRTTARWDERNREEIGPPLELVQMDGSTVLHVNEVRASAVSRQRERDTLECTGMEFLPSRRQYSVASVRGSYCSNVGDSDGVLHSTMSSVRS